MRLIVPPRASVTWSGRGRSNRPIGGVGRASNAFSSSLCDGSSICSQRRTCVADEVFFCNACQARSSDSNCGRLVFGNDGGHDTGAGGPNEPANGRDLSCVSGEWRSQRRARECVDGGGLSGRGDGGELSQAWLMAGEVIHILRPLVYSYSCGSAGERSWHPWLTSLGMDAAAYACSARAGGGGARSLLTLVGSARSKAGDGVPVLPCLDDEQAAELRRRKMLWFLYVMRSPAFELLAEPVSRGAAGVFEGVPLLGGMAGYALSMLLYVQRHHFYTSAS